MCFSSEKKKDFYLVRKMDKVAAWDNSCTPNLHNKIRTRTLAIKIQQ